MQRLKLRLSTRHMMILIALFGVLFVPLTEETLRRNQRTYRLQQEDASERRAMLFFKRGQAAYSSNKKEEAARNFNASNYWNERARGHREMAQQYQRWTWLFNQ